MNDPNYISDYGLTVSSSMLKAAPAYLRSSFAERGTWDTILEVTRRQAAARRRERRHTGTVSGSRLSRNLVMHLLAIADTRSGWPSCLTRLHIQL